MKKKILCLLIALVMIIPMCLMAGCANNEEEDATGEVAEKASETTKTLTMFLITERHVYTADEVNKIKEQHGTDSSEYIEAKGVMDSYTNVANALDKITKAKFRTHLIVYFYTIEEYKAVEALMDYQTRAAAIKSDATKALNAFKRQQKALGNTDTAVVASMFYAEHPEYAEYTDVTTDPNAETTEAETIINEYGIQELKYPDAKNNQVDIVCVSGYDNYLRYVENGWLASLDSELDSSSKAILTYVNEKFIEAAALNSNTYGIPTNTTIGNYTYLLINKELYTEYQYDGDSVGSLNLSSADLNDFLKDIYSYAYSDANLAAEDKYVPLTGELDLLNTLFWSLNYEYTSAGTARYDAENKKFTVEVNGEQQELDPEVIYYGRTGNETDGYEYYHIFQTPEDDVIYYEVIAKKFTGSAFADDTVYYTRDDEGFYTPAAEYVSGTDYYTIDSSSFTKNYKALNKVDSEKKVEPLEEFELTKTYYVANATKTATTRIYTLRPDTELFVVENVNFDRNEFSVLGQAMTSTSQEVETQLSANLFGTSGFRNQLLTIQNLKDKGYYDADAINDPNKQFAVAVVEGGADLAEKYGDEYYMTILEYPRAYTEEVCKNMFAVSSASVNLSASMEVVTYLTINSDFRNIMQYGIENSNYTVSYITEEETGKSYPVVKRINSYYQMDLSKTGNNFIAYPEEGMDYNIWDYGKIQNRDAKYDQLTGFSFIDRVNKIDFAEVDKIKKLSADYKTKLDACTSYDELNTVLTEMETELKANSLYTVELATGVQLGSGAAPVVGAYNAYGIYHAYMEWWGPLYYVEEE